MKKSSMLAVLILGFAGAIASVPASADSTLYDNTGPWSAGSLQFPIGEGYVVSDSFTLTSNSTVTGVDLIVLVESGDLPSTVDWSIGTTPFGGTPATATTTNLGLINSPFLSLYDNYEMGFAIPDVPLDAGTYYLTLQNVVEFYGGDPNNPRVVFWNASNGPSIAYASGVGNLNGADYPGSNSETFQILGNTSSVTPEPSSILLLASGLAGLAGMARRKLRA